MSWTPASLFAAADTGAWFDLSDLAQLFQDSAGLTPIAGDSQPLGLVRAKFGAGAKAFDFFQVTSSAKPTYIDGTAQFDGGDWMDSGTTRFGRTGLFAAVSEAFTVAIAYVNVTGTTSMTFLGRAPATGHMLSLQRLNGYTDAMRFSLRGGVTAMGSVTTAGVAAVRWTGAVARGWSNELGPSALTVNAAAETSTQRITLGARNNGSELWLPPGSRIAQVLLIDRDLSDDEVNWLRWYFSQKIGQSYGTAPPAPTVHDLGAVTALGAASVSSSAVAQLHVLDEVSALADGAPHTAAVTSIQSLGGASVTATSVVAVGATAIAHQLTPVSTTSTASVSAPVLAQTHALGVVDAQASAEVMSGAVRQTHVLHAATATAPALISAGAIGVPGGLESANATAAVTVDAPTVQQVHQLAPVSGLSAAEVAASSVRTVQALAAADVAAVTAVAVPTISQTHVLASADAVALAVIFAAPLQQQLPPPPELPADDYRTRSVTPVFATRSASPRLHSVSRSPVYCTRAA